MSTTITKSSRKARGAVVALAATALWAFAAVPTASADSSSSTKVKSRSSSPQTSSRASSTRGTSTRSSSGSTSSGRKVTPPSTPRSAPPSTSRVAPQSRGTDSSDSRAGRKIPSRGEVDRGTPRYPRYRPHYPYYRYYDPFYYPYWRSSFYWGLPYYGGYYHYGYGPGYHYPHRPYPRTHYDYDRGPGALDLDVSPERAEIYVDGERLGTADDFDGFPGYLWLESGVYDLVVYSPGYRTIARQITIRPGEIVDVEDRMEEGEAERPEDLFAKTTERRDDRLERDRERAERAAGAAEAQPWEEHDDRGYVPEVERPADDGYAYDLRGAAARIHLRVGPGDAAIYLDGRFIGTGEDLSRLPGGLVVEPGDHVLEVTRPGYRHETREIEVDEDEEIEVEVDLDRS